MYFDLTWSLPPRYFSKCPFVATESVGDKSKEQTSTEVNASKATAVSYEEGEEEEAKVEEMIEVDPSETPPPLPLSPLNLCAFAPKNRER